MRSIVLVADVGNRSSGIQMKMLPVVILIVMTPVTLSSHSLQYYHRMVSDRGHGLPEYISVGYVDGIQITRYSSDTGQARPVAHWMQRLEHEYWKDETENNKRAKSASETNLKIAMNRFNQVEGFHSFQEMYGCERKYDGSTWGYWQYGYDGMDFLALDTERWIYYPITDQAQKSAQRWNEPEQRTGARAKYYLETDCIYWLRKYLEYGKEELERRVRPEVNVSSRPSGSAMKLHCQVYGFYPRDVDVNWKKNGMDIPSDEAKQVLPNSDGTYQTRVSVEVTPEDGASYSCHVDHSSLNETLIVPWDSQRHGVNRDMRTTRIVCVFAAVVLVIVGCIAAKFFSVPCTDERLQIRLGHFDPASGNDDFNVSDQHNHVEEIIVQANDPEPQG